jgi:hypothetical protein
MSDARVLLNHCRRLVRAIYEKGSVNPRVSLQRRASHGMARMMLQPPRVFVGCPWLGGGQGVPRCASHISPRCGFLALANGSPVAAVVKLPTGLWAGRTVSTRGLPG